MLSTANNWRHGKRRRPTCGSRSSDIEQPYRDKYRDIAIDRFPDDLIAIARKPADQRTPDEEQLAYLVQRQVESEYERLDQYLTAEDKEKLVALRRELKAFDNLKPSPLPMAMTVAGCRSHRAADRDAQADARSHRAGSPFDP